MRKAFGLFIALAIGAILAQSAWGLGSIQLEQIFGGKGAGHGGFGEKIRIHVDAAGNVYVSDAEARVVQKFSPEGQFLWQIPADPTEQPIFQRPEDLCTDDAGNLYVTDYTARHLEGTDNPRVYVFTPCVYRFDPQGNLTATIAIDEMKARPKTVLPVKIMLDEQGRSAYAIQPKYYDRSLRVAWSPKGFLYVLDIQMATITKYQPDGTRVKSFGRYGAGPGEMDEPQDLTIDAQGSVWVADTGNHRILKFSPEGEFVLSVGRKGRGKAEFVKPQLIEATQNGLVLVKDSSQFTRALYKSPVYGPTLEELTAPSARSYLFGPRRLTPTTDLTTRVRLLEEMEYLRLLDETEGDSEQEAEEEDLERLSQRLRNTLYHNVIERVQVFDTNGRYRDRVLYRIDKQDAQKHDLQCVALDSRGRLYLRDASDFTLLRYRINGFGLQRSALNALYTTRTQNGANQYNEDYEDIDLDPDVADEENLFQWEQRFLLNYDLSERWNLSLQNRLVYNERDNRYVTPPKIEDSFTYSDQGWDNILGLNLRYVTNPNPYHYKELNLYARRLDGQTDGGSEALLTDRNRQRSEGTGDARSYVLGLDWDIFRKTNLTLEFMNLDPNQTARNYTRTFYDVSGDLHERFRSFNRARIWSAELTVSF